MCIDRKAGDYPIKVFTAEVGTRRPLGVGAGSLAVLGSMPDDEAVAVIEALKGHLKSYPEQLRRGILPSVRAARKAGYAVSDGLVLPSVIGVGVAIRDRRGVAIGTLGIASFKDSGSDRRIAEYAAMLMCEQARIERVLRDKFAAAVKSPAPASRRPSLRA